MSRPTLVLAARLACALAALPACAATAHRTRPSPAAIERSPSAPRPAAQGPGVTEGAAAPAPPPPIGATAPTAHAYRRYRLELEAATIGVAEEDEQRDGDRVQLRRRERLRFRRGPELVRLDTELELAGSLRGGAERVAITIRDCSPPEPAAGGRDPRPPACPAGPLSYHGQATRGPAGWRVVDDDGTRWLPWRAAPAEWLDLTPQRTDLLAVPLFFAARHFVLGVGSRRWSGPRRWSGAVAIDGALLETTTELGDDDRPRRSVEASGTAAIRVDDEPGHELDSLAARADDARQDPDALADVVELTSLAIAGTAAPRGRLRFELRAAANASISQPIPQPIPQPIAPPISQPFPQPIAAPGQRARADHTGWLIELVPTVTARRERAAIAAIAALARSIADDAELAGLRGAGGDCTAHALRYAAAAARRGWPTRLATGYILDGASLVRHRWAVTFTGRSWIAVDPSSGEAPAPPVLVTLALHDASPEALAGAEAAFAPLRGARVRWLR